MAIVNQYKFLGQNIATTDETTLLTPAIASSGAVETVIIVNAQTLSANASTEILTLPLILESGVALKVTMSSGDSVDIGISYLNINQEVVV